MVMHQVSSAGSAVRPDAPWLFPPWIDIAIAAAFVALSVAESVFSANVGSPLVHVLVSGAAMTTLAWRRRFPLAVAALVMGSDIALNPQNEFSTLLSLFVVPAFYTLLAPYTHSPEALAHEMQKLEDATPEVQGHA